MLGGVEDGCGCGVVDFGVVVDGVVGEVELYGVEGEFYMVMLIVCVVWWLCDFGWCWLLLGIVVVRLCGCNSFWLLGSCCV